MTSARRRNAATGAAPRGSAPASRRTPSSSSGGIEQREGQAQRGLGAALGGDRSAGREHDAAAAGLGVERAFVERPRERDPDVVAALRRVGVVLAGEVPLERRHQGVAALAVEGDRAVPRGARRRRWRASAPLCAGSASGSGSPASSLSIAIRSRTGAAGGDPAAAQAAAHDLRERVGVDDVRRARARGAGARAGPSKCMSAYTRSSRTKKLRSIASSARRRRRSSERLRPVGFWQALCSPTSLTSWRASRRSSASTSKPCSSTGTPITRAPDCAQRGHHPDEGGRLDDGHVARLEGRPCGERDRLLGARGDHDLVGVLGLAVARARAGRAARAGRTVPRRGGRRTPRRRPPRTPRRRSRQAAAVG